MSYLKFDRTGLTNLDEALDQELLRTNGRGAYSCSTILGCNTRKYHGLLVVPAMREPSLEGLGARSGGFERWVLLSSLDETVLQHGAEFNLAVHKYADGSYHPNGHKYVRELDVERATKTTYRVGGVVLSREVVFAERRNQLMIKYTLLEAHSEMTLRLKPLLASRKSHELTYENPQIRWDYQEVEQGISMTLYEGTPRCFMQFSKPVAYHHTPHWNKQVYYNKEAERGNPCVEDLPVPGYFECQLRKGEELYFSVSDELVETSHLAAEFKEEVDLLIPRDSFTNCLRSAANQFYYTPTDEEAYLQAGFPWFGVRHRDQMIGLTACSYGIGRPERYQAVMETTLEALKKLYEEGRYEGIIEGLEQPDALLWLLNCIQDYSRWVGMSKTREEYGSVVQKALEYLRSNKHPQMRVMENGLLYALPDATGAPISWMDNRIEGATVVDRRGYLVEYNALWYNALCFNRVLFGLEDDREDDFIARVGESFVRIFVNEYDYLFDYVVEGESKDWDVRPNQLLAAGLSYSPLSRKLQRSIVDIATKELLTPKGMRSLSPKSGRYKGYVRGTAEERAYAMLQGGVWSWLIYYYLSAYFKLFRRVGVSFVDRLLIPFEDELRKHGIGTISEYYDGTPPYRGRGGISFMVSVAAVLRIQNRLAEYEEYESEDIFDLRLSMTSHHSTSPEAGREPEVEKEDD